MFEKICETLHQEMHQIEQKLADGKTRMSNQDLEDVDKIAHALKSLATYEAMKGESEYSGDSYARGRSRTTGRYMSREGGSMYGGGGSNYGGSNYGGGSNYYPQEMPESYGRRY